MDVIKLEGAIVMSQSPFLSSVREFMLARHYSVRTIDAYLYWIKQFILFNDRENGDSLEAVLFADQSTLIALFGHRYSNFDGGMNGIAQ